METKEKTTAPQSGQGAPMQPEEQAPRKGKGAKAAAAPQVSRPFLYMTAFLSGMSVMGIELGASRLLAPYFSSSQIVWTVIIGTIMIAMALGNVWGGRMADKNPDPARLYRRLLIAALWTAAIPIVGKYVIVGVSFILALFVKSGFLIWASLFSCIVLFGFPLMLLGTVTPSLMKFAVTSLTDSGKTVGTIEALGTIGSIIGTFLPTFVTIPLVGTSVSFLLFSGVLAAICLAYFITVRRHRVRGAVSAAIVLALLFARMPDNPAFWQHGIVYEGESIYNYLQVRETPDRIILSTNVLEGVQSVKMKGQKLTGMYYDYALAAPLMAGIPAGGRADGAPPRVLILGLGTGTFATLCEEYYGDPEIQGVEIDAKIVALAQDYFDLPDSVETIVADGRAFLQNGDPGQYDVIMVDAYQDITIPFQMSSIEFFRLVNDHLNPGGVMVVNMNMYSQTAGSINDYLADTIGAVFSAVYTADAGGNSNRLLFAGQSDEIAERLDDACRQNPAGDPFWAQMHRVNNALQRREAGGLILTDDKAPVELLGMRVMDEMIGETLSYYRAEMEGMTPAEMIAYILGS